MGRKQNRRQTIASAAQSVVQRLEERRMLSVSLDEGTWTIDLTDDDRNHVISVDVSPTNASKLKLTIDGKLAGSAAIADLVSVEIDTGAGNDKITFNIPNPDLWVDVYAGDGNDTITGGGGDDDLSGEGSDDSIMGGGGHDYLWGDEGSDTINGGKGDDEIYADDGNDQIDGGGGDDTIYAGNGDDDISGDEGDDDIWGGTGDDEIDGDEGDDAIAGGRGMDDLDGGDGDDQMAGGGGRDQLVGGAGDDELDGRNGADTLAGGLGEDSLHGGNGADQEDGGFDNDQVKGQAGNDTIWGGAGIDTLAGGPNRDTIYNEDGVDQIAWGRWDTSRNQELVNPLHKADDDADFKNWLIDRAVANNRWLLGSGTSRTWYEGDSPYYYSYSCNVYYAIGRVTTASLSLMVDDAEVSTVAASVNSQLANGDFSQTNTQEQGVDEADLIKTDGEYLYLVSGGKVLILDAQPPEQTKVISSIQLPNSDISGLYLDGDRLTVISQAWQSRPLQDTGDAKLAAWLGFSYRSYVKVTVYDVSDRTNPVLSEETEINGRLTESREVDGRLYLVVSNNLDLPRPLALLDGDPVELAEGRYWPGRQDFMNRPVDFTPEPGAEDRMLEWKQWGQKYHYETEAAFRARLQGMTINDLLPGYTVGSGDNAVRGGLAGQIYVPDDPHDYVNQMSSVVLLNLDDSQPGPTASTTIFGMQGQVYASTENLYVTTQVWETPMGNWQGQTRTDIYKFGLGESSVDLEATGEVPGWVLNSFSMDDEQDQFRIATSNSEAGASNNVFVLTQDDDQLQIVGGITGLALTERIFAARFVADKAYLVTFPVAMRGWDPLFTVDLSDATRPKVMGELAIPGYSTYLHPIDDGHLLAVGRSGQDVEVSLFDVSDMAHPRRVDLFTITGGWETWSAAEREHHAFAYFPEHHILALPTVTFTSPNMLYQTILLNVDNEKGLSELGRINGSPFWSDQRNVRIGEFIYAFFGTRLKVVSLASPDVVVADVDLTGPQVNQPVEAANIEE